MVAQVKKGKIAKYGHWKRREESVVLAIIDGEVKGKCRVGRDALQDG